MKLRSMGIAFGMVGTVTLVQAGPVDRMAVVSAPKSFGVGTCSTALTVQAQDSTLKPATSSSNIKVFFTGSDPSLSFFKDSACTLSAGSVVILAGTSNKDFYIKGSVSGSKSLIVATYNYTDGGQTETLIASGTTTPVPSPTPIASATPIPTLPTLGRSIPAPLYGITLDNVSNAVLPGEIASIQHLNHTPTSRVVFDPGMSPSYYSPQISQLRGISYIMGQISDSSSMKSYSVSSYQARAQDYVSSLGSLVDVWEVGNEVNGNWLGTSTIEKVQAAYDVVANAKGATALTFFYMGEPSDVNNCIDAPGDDLFTWITQKFQLGLPVSQRSIATERLRLGLNYALISWYPQGCNNLQPDWITIYTKLASIFPNAKVGFGELGTASVQNGSSYEVNLINQYYPLASKIALPSNYIGGYFWWNYAEEMVPYPTSTLFQTLNNAIK